VADFFPVDGLYSAGRFTLDTEEIFGMEPTDGASAPNDPVPTPSPAKAFLVFAVYFLVQLAALSIRVSPGLMTR
jgi:hypothetical protein